MKSVNAIMISKWREAMKKLYEIPIYAITQTNLREKNLEFISKFRKESIEVPSDIIDAALEIETYPQRLWDYNHLCGFIRITYDRTDIFYDIFLPVTKIQRYSWRGTRKHFVYNILVNGTHFYVDENMSNESIQSQMFEMLNYVINLHVPKKFFVDRDAFDNTYKYMNFKEINKEI